MQAIGRYLAIALAFAALGWQAMHWRDQRNAERTAHVQTIRNVWAGQAAAKALEDARIATEKARTERIAANALQSYHSRLDALSVAYNRLRAQAGSVGSSRSGQSVPGLSDAAGGTTAQTGSCGFSLERRRVASEQAVQLDELISAVTGFAGDPASSPPDGLPAVH